jgi:hypothetical protein
MVFLICFEQNADFLQETISFGASLSENKKQCFLKEKLFGLSCFFIKIPFLFFIM